MKSHEFIQAAADLLSAFGGSNAAPEIDLTASGKLHQVEPELDDKSETGNIFVAPLQAKLELLKKAVNVDNIYDDQSQDELSQIKKLSGINPVVTDEAGTEEPLDV